MPDQPRNIQKPFTDKFPADIQFKFPWRKYQQRVLDELEEHIEDNHLHIIAPPGSGKTVLGLEVTLRLNKPTLIFAPTVAIRNQWIQRFCDLFLQVDKKPDWISRDIRNPGFLTVATYQALHAACAGVDIDEDDEGLENEDISQGSRVNSHTKQIIERLREENIGTIVVDEAHHLKNAWWKSLTAIKKTLDPTIVGLTATPPYDVSPGEWQRYIELNGPVDAEISVPELVVEGDLCPHQDYVIISEPSYEEIEQIKEYRHRIEQLFYAIQQDETLIKALESHPIYTAPEDNLDWIYSNLEYYSSTLIFLNAVGRQISNTHLEVIGDKKFTIPNLTYEWMETLLSFYLYEDPVNFAAYEDHQKELSQRLTRNSAMERRTINFSHNRKINSLLSSSINKLDSIDKIVDFEHDHLGQDLRMVILTDYIRKEYLVNQAENNLELTRIGVIPIFEKLRRTNTRNIKIGVLTGSLIIIPFSAVDAFREAARKYNVDKLSASPLPYDEGYLVISSTEQIKHDIVHIVTQIFQEGHIEVLAGTKSLLGEGWDAPAINSLILASFVGSYVLSNQMRGRAIRTMRSNLDKTANIWHLACIDPTSNDSGDDIQLMKRRFKAFVGVSFREEISIENGIARLNLPSHFKTAQDIQQSNEQMYALAGERDVLKKKWQTALESGTLLIEEIKIPFAREKRPYKEVKALYLNRTIAYLAGMLTTGIGTYLLEVLINARQILLRTTSFEDLTYILLPVGIGGVAIFGRLTYITFRSYIKYRDISKDVHNIGVSLLQSLIKVGVIHTDYSEITVVTERDEQGAVYSHLEGATTYEKSIFIKSLREIISPVRNPRYIIIRKSFFVKLLSQHDYHAVPELIGRNKRSAEYFENRWRALVGACELVFTRTIEGRKLLLKSRIHSLAAQFEAKSERINKWS